MLNVNFKPNRMITKPNCILNMCYPKTKVLPCLPWGLQALGSFY